MDSGLNILVIEDHDLLRAVVVETLSAQGHRVAALESVEAVESHTATDRYDLVVLDLQLPGEDGLSYAQRLRRHQPGIGIIMMTARGLTQEKCAGYESGADIYLTKPVEPDELCAAAQAVGRRVRQATQFAAPCLDRQRMTLTGTDGIAIPLSSLEARMLSALILAPGQRLENWQLVELLGKSVDAYSKAALELHIVRLRKKLGQLGEASAHAHSIQAIRGWGYQLCVPLVLA
ncbi:response regulator transcription factor [Pararobbsia silviterrae]|uniref:DNA-binding response regulator n=1 Tax=Pararobbsia silviterrae TaxID=1792498 RepID=A0A494Y4W2_9BURK|nr:response regulator transcription factor [Pararobbsia silviterrae]RKP57681.1 DNA-binding response regulator [Pararobbsia silviterrae]